MKHYKTINDDYIFAISIGRGQTEITEEEYNHLMGVIKSAPTATRGYTYKLRADTLEWEQVELPPVPEPELSDTEVLEILLGVNHET